LVAVPPRGTPPLDPVEEVPVVPVLVADELVAVDAVCVWVLEVLVELELVVVVVVLVWVLVAVLVVWALRHSWIAS
jgi:hypothetical protein